MPTSRKRRRPKRRQQGVRRSPYETLIRGVHTDERMGEWFRRACWSFHRAPFPVYPELDAQNNAMARALEWFMFDVVLPDSDRSPAEEWIAGESQRQGWGAPVLERYLRFTRGKYGLYEVVTAPLPMLVLRQVGTERVVHARALDNPVPFEDGDIIAARLFPLEDAAAQRTDPEIFDLSPCSDVVPELEESVLLAAVEQGALGVETLYGAAPDWVANGIAAGEIGPLADAFFDAVSDGSLQRVDLQQELREVDDPWSLIAALNRELVPLTPEEPALLSAVIAALWMMERQKAGASVETLRDLAEGLERKLTAAAPVTPVPASPSVDDPAWELSAHEIARLRSIPQVADAEWIGRRRQVRLPIHETGKLPEYPDAIVWVEEPSDVLLGATIVPPQEPSSALLTTLVEAISEPAPGAGDVRRPARVFVQSQMMAARLRKALAPLEIEVQARYVEPALSDLFAGLEEDAANDPDDDIEDADPPPMGYLNLPGSTPALVERLFIAAAEFYRAAPWKVVADDVWLDLEFPAMRDAFGSELSHAIAVIMGYSRQTFGLALYFSPSDLMRVQMGGAQDEALHFDAVSIVFDKAADTDESIVAEIREHQWPVADGRGHPTAMRTSPIGPPRLVAGPELALAAGALDAVREFVSRHASAMRPETEAQCAEDLDVAGLGRVHVSFDPPPDGP